MPLATPSSVHSERCTIVPRRRYIKSRDGPHIDGKSESRSSSHLFPSFHFSVPRYKPKVPAPSRQPRSCVIAAARRGDLSGWMSTGQSISGGSAVRTGRSTFIDYWLRAAVLFSHGLRGKGARRSRPDAHARDPQPMPQRSGVSRIGDGRKHVDTSPVGLSLCCDWIEAATVTRPPPPLNAAATGHRQPGESWPRCSPDDECRSRLEGRRRSRKSPRAGTPSHG